jgi:hypothetical protein
MIPAQAQAATMARTCAHVAHGLAGAGYVAVPQQVFLPEGPGRHAQLLCQLVHHRFGGEVDLRRAEATHTAGIAVVGIGRFHAHVHVFHPIGACGFDTAAPCGGLALGQVCAAVHKAPHLNGGQCAVPLCAGLVVDVKGMPLYALQQRLTAAPRHAAGPPGVQRRDSGSCGHSPGVVILAAEGPAHTGLRHPYSAHGQTAGRRHDTPDVEGRLARAVDPQLSVLRRHHHALRLDGPGDHPLGAELPFHNDVRLVKALCRPPLADAVFQYQVSVVVQLGRVRQQCFLRVEYRGHGLGVIGDQPRRPVCRLL